MATSGTQRRVQRDPRQGKSASTQAGEFIRKEIHAIRAGRHGARSAKQVIAIGLSKARRAGVALKPPSPGRTSVQARRKAVRDYERGHGAPAKRAVTAKRRRASAQALRRESTAAASPRALSAQATQAAKRRSPASRSAAARQASRTKGGRHRSGAARKAAHTRARRSEHQQHLGA